MDLVVLDQGIDTSTAIGRMFFQILGSIAEFEHSLMSETNPGRVGRCPCAGPHRRAETKTRLPTGQAGPRNV